MMTRGAAGTTSDRRRHHGGPDGIPESNQAGLGRARGL